MPHPLLIPVGIGVGLLAAVGAGLRVRALAKKPAIDPAAAAAANATLKQQITTGLANGTVKLGTNGVPFQAVPIGPVPTANQVIAGLTDPTTKLIGVLPKDLLTVNSSVLADSLVAGSTSIPGFQPNENILMEVVTAGQIGNMAPDPASGAVSQGSTGPFSAISRDPRLTLAAPIQVPLVAITGVQPQDAAALDAAAAAAAQKP